ncbi:unnamed protein product [Caenorhabditis bovis]|uniref:Bardet-Biedl syndrome 2 protein homolog n=1 Tax=Caenorhabditis bovis TaxID=2654633 RepID=A0A8S1F8C7_9PELO|nr:unnamed protein product [Caenorhabditis bovis]
MGTFLSKSHILDSETALNIAETIRCIAAAPFGPGYDYLLIGTDSHVICYDVHNNQTIFRNEVPDGVNCFAVGKVAENPPAIYCGGNCCIWGFDKDGGNCYWTVTGDVVTTMCICDYDNDGENELIIGSPDYEIRVFKNDLMRWEMMETDAVLSLVTVSNNAFGYALANGTVGVYRNQERTWRIKSKNNISAMFRFPDDNLMTCVWKHGKIDMRFVSNGDISSKDQSLSGAVSAATISRKERCEDSEITIILADGKVHGYKLQQRKEPVDSMQELIREFGQKKHNLMMELSNYEAEEQLTDADKERDQRIPIDTTVNCLYVVNYDELTLNLVIEASHKIFVRAVIIFAEGLFEGESYIWIPTADKQGDRVVIPLVPEKDQPNDMHIKSFLGHVDAYKLHVFEMARLIPRFARFTLTSNPPFWNEPTCFVEFEFKAKPGKFFDWVHECFVVDEKTEAFDPDLKKAELKFIGLAPKKGICLCFRYDVQENKMVIYHDCIETTGNIIQHLAAYFQISNVESHAQFANEFKEADEILSEIDSMTELRDRLTAELQERQSTVKETLIRAEDSITIDNIPEARKFYLRLKQMESAARQAALLRWNNNERCVKSLRRLHKIIENAAKLRVGEPNRRIVSACRSAIADDNKQVVVKILEFGAA